MINWLKNHYTHYYRRHSLDLVHIYILNEYIILIYIYTYVFLINLVSQI